MGLPWFWIAAQKTNVLISILLMGLSVFALAESLMRVFNNVCLFPGYDIKTGRTGKSSVGCSASGRRWELYRQILIFPNIKSYTYLHSVASDSIYLIFIKILTTLMDFNIAINNSILQTFLQNRNKTHNITATFLGTPATMIQTNSKALRNFIFIPPFFYRAKDVGWSRRTQGSLLFFKHKACSPY